VSAPSEPAARTARRQSPPSARRRRREHESRRFTARDARAIAIAENRVAKLVAELELATEERARVRARLLPLLPPSTHADEAEKGVRQASAGGYRVRVSPVDGHDIFSLKRYLERGHQVTEQMREAMNRTRGFDRWTVRPVKGPARPGSVEPSDASWIS
jgi:hypothetical protein